MKKIIFGTALAILIFSSCEKGIFSKKRSELTNFEITQNSDTVPAIIRVKYTIEAENDCAEYSIDFSGADSTRTVLYDKNKPDAIDEAVFYEANNIDDGEICAKGEPLILKYIQDLKYLNSGNYKISITLNGETETKLFSLSDSK